MLTIPPNVRIYLVSSAPHIIAGMPPTSRTSGNLIGQPGRVGAIPQPGLAVAGETFFLVDRLPIRRVWCRHRKLPGEHFGFLVHRRLVAGWWGDILGQGKVACRNAQCQGQA